MDLTELGQVKGEMIMAIVIAAANQKGGCSKTSVVANLGIGLALKGKKVCLIDADPQGSLTASLGYQEPDEIRYTLANCTHFCTHLQKKY